MYCRTYIFIPSNASLKSCSELLYARLPTQTRLTFPTEDSFWPSFGTAPEAAILISQESVVVFLLQIKTGGGNVWWNNEGTKKFSRCQKKSANFEHNCANHWSRDGNDQYIWRIFLSVNIPSGSQYRPQMLVCLRARYLAALILYFWLRTWIEYHSRSVARPRNARTDSSVWANQEKANDVVLSSIYQRFTIQPTNVVERISEHSWLSFIISFAGYITRSVSDIRNQIHWDGLPVIEERSPRSHLPAVGLTLSVCHS